MCALCKYTHNVGITLTHFQCLTFLSRDLRGLAGIKVYFSFVNSSDSLGPSSEHNWHNTETNKMLTEHTWMLQCIAAFVCALLATCLLMASADDEMSFWIGEPPILDCQKKFCKLKVTSQEWNIAQCPRCQVRLSCSRNLPAVTTGGKYWPVDTTWSIRKSSFSNDWNKLSSNSNNKNMLQVVTTRAYYPPVATKGAYYAHNGEIRVWESQKLTILLVALIWTR